MPGTTTDTVPAMLTPGEFVIKRESAKMLGLPFLRKLNEVSDNAAHENIDALIGQAQLANMKPMLNGGNVVPGYENGDVVENESQVERARRLHSLKWKPNKGIPLPIHIMNRIDPSRARKYAEGIGYENGGNVVKDDDPLQIDMRMRNPSVYAGSKISPFWGDTVAVPDAWMQPATEQMPTPEQQEAQHAKLLEQLNKIRIEQLIEKLKEEEIFNPQSLDYNGGGRLNIQEKTNSKGQPWSDFMQMLPYYESQQSPIPNRPPLPR